MAGSIHYRKHRGGTASRNTMALDIQQRTPQHGHWRNNTRSETEIGRLSSTNVSR